MRHTSHIAQRTSTSARPARRPPITRALLPLNTCTPSHPPTWYSSLSRLLFFCSVYIWISSA